MGAADAAVGRRKLILWELGNFLFISLFGAALHYVFELSGFNRSIAWLGAVNESTWEHLKLVFWPAFIFALVEYTYVRHVARNYLLAKTTAILVMMGIIIATWYIYTPFTGNINWLNIVLFYVAVIVGEIVAFRMLTAPEMRPKLSAWPQAALLLLVLAFTLFTYFPPHFSLFEHFDLQDTGEYGILDDYTDLRVFR